MAKIIIELDTATDSLGDVIQRLQMREFERWITHTIDRSHDHTGAPVGPFRVELSVDPAPSKDAEAPAGSTTVQFSEKPILLAVETGRRRAAIG